MIFQKLKKLPNANGFDLACLAAHVISSLLVIQAVITEEGVVLEAILCTHKHW